MNDREYTRYEMFERVSIFCKDNAADFTNGPERTKHVTALNQIIADLDKAKAGQQGGGVTAKEVLLDSLRLDVQNIARTARAIAQDEPGFADNFQRPANYGEKDLRTTTDAFLVELAKAGVANKFIAHELPSDFLQSLTGGRQAIDAADSAKESGRVGGVASTAAVGRLIREGMKEVNYLDAIMYNKYTRNADKLRAWQSASHIERAPQREKTPTPPTPPPA